jgi:YHS domain-containing protein
MGQELERRPETESEPASPRPHNLWHESCNTYRLRGSLMATACPICGTTVLEGEAKLEFSYHGKIFRLCTLQCLRIFEQFPDVYGDDITPDVQLLEDVVLN